MTSSAKPSVTLDISGHAAYLTFTRPDRANTIDPEFGRQFRAATETITTTPGVRAVLVSGEGDNFCFGGNLNSMMTSGIDVHRYLRQLTTDLHAGIVQLAGLEAPVLAAVNGTAAGAGLGLVLAADLVLAAKGARFTAAYLGVALTPDAGCTYLLPRLVGRKRAMEMFLTSRMLDAEEAMSWGIVNHIVEDQDLAAKAATLVMRLAAGPIGAYAALKRLMSESEAGFAEQLERESVSIAERGASAEGQEGISAFLGKRPARYD